MTTPRDIVKLALKDSGVLGIGQLGLAEDFSDGFTTLNQMIAEWARRRWLIYKLTDLSFASTGSQTYTVGPGGNYNIALRPERIEAAYVRQTNVGPVAYQPDYPLQIIDTYEDYSRLTLKQIGPFPYSVFYDPQYPLGVLYPWPVPQTGIYTVHIVVVAALSQFADLDETITLPPEYEAALRYNLARRFYASYPVPERKSVIDLATSTLSTIINANFAPARLRMPAAVIRPGIYNIYSDQDH